MGKCIVNPSGVSFNGGETKDAKPPGVGGGYGEGGGKGLLVTIWVFFPANEFFFFLLVFCQKHFLKGYLGNRVSNGFP